MSRLISLPILFALLFTLILAGCQGNENKSNEPLEVSLRFDWVANMSYLGDVMALEETADSYGIKLRAEQAGFGVDPIKLVVTGTDDFGIASFEQMLMANEKGADLVAIGIINDISPVVFLAKEEKKFSTPTDFEDKSVGINPGGATEIVYRIFLKKHSIDNRKVKEIPADFDIKSFINGNYDIRLAFAYVEPVDLKTAGIPFKQLSPIEFGLKLPGRVYFTRRETIEKSPELVQLFVNAVAKGWEMALMNKEKAIDYLKKFEPSIDTARETQSFEIGRAYFSGFEGKVLSFDQKNLSSAAQELVQSGVLKSADFTRALNPSFIDRYHLSKDR